MQTSAYVPCKLLGPHQAATASGASQGEIPHSWEPQTNAGLPLKLIWATFLRSWRKHIQENEPYGRLPAHQHSSAGQSPRKRAGGAQKHPSLIELTPLEEVAEAARSKPRLGCRRCQRGLTHLFTPAMLLTGRQGLAQRGSLKGRALWFTASHCWSLSYR